MGNEVMGEENMINICRTIREMANLGQVKYCPNFCNGKNESSYAYFLKYLDYCGMSPDSYVWEYCLCLQPYMIESYCNDGRMITVLCNIYGISSTYVRVEYACENAASVLVSLCPRWDRKRSDDVAVACEAEVNGTMLQHSSSDGIFVFEDRICAMVENSDSYSIEVLVQCGIKMLPICIGATRNAYGFRVRRMAYIHQPLERMCLEYIESAKLEDRNVFTNISILIDVLLRCRDYQVMGMVDFALVGYIHSLRLTSEMKKELMDKLEGKYGIGEGRVLVERVRDCVEGELYGIIGGGGVEI